MNLYRQIPFFALALLPLLLVQSCTKTEYLEYEQEALTRILEFKIQNSPEEMYGAIDHTNNTITVYIPYYTALDYLDPLFKLDEGAVLVDEEDNEINMDGGLVPIAFGDTVQYTVRAATGTKRTYTVFQKIRPHEEQLVIQIQPIPTDSEIAYGRINYGKTLKGNFQSLSHHGKVILTNRASGEIFEDTNAILSMELEPDGQYMMTVRFPPYLMEGDYDMRIEHQGRSADISHFFSLSYDFGYAHSFGSSASSAPGDIVTFDKSSGGLFVGLERVYMRIASVISTEDPNGLPEELLNTPIEMELVETTRTITRVVFPDIPPGKYRIWFMADFDDQTDWGKGVVIGSSSNAFGYTVLPKAE